MKRQAAGPRPTGDTDLLKRLAARPARIPSKVVLGGDAAVVIVHDAEEYLLRVTDEGKLELSR